MGVLFLCVEPAVDWAFVISLVNCRTFAPNNGKNLDNSIAFLLKKIHAI